MAHALYLTADERTLFNKLPEKLKEGWEVKDEKGKYHDDDKKRMLRATFMSLHDPALKDLQHKMRTADSQEDLMRSMNAINISKISAEDLTEMLFVIGADGMSMMISHLLHDANHDADLNAVAFISGVRNTFITTAVSA